MQLIEKFKNNYSHMFDFYDNYVLDNKEFILYAKFYQRNAKYFGSKKLEIYSFSNNEHMFIYDVSTFDYNEIKYIKEFLNKNVDSIVNPNDEHMSTVITMVIIADNISDEAKKMISKFKYHKSFKLGFNGWVNVKLIVILKDKDIAFENKFAKGDSSKLGFI